MILQSLSRYALHAIISVASLSALHAQIITPVGATSTTTIGGTRTILAAVDGTGLLDTDDPDNSLDDTHDGGIINTHFLTDVIPFTDGVNTTEVLTFELGGSFDVDTIYYWPYNRPERSRGIRTFDLSFSRDNGETYTPPVSATSLGMEDWVIGSSDGLTRSAVITRSFQFQAGITHVRLSNIATFGSDRIALAEIRFGGSGNPVPNAPEITEIATNLHGDTPNVKLTWRSSPGVSYRVEYSTDLEVWNTALSTTSAENGTTTSATHDFLPNLQDLVDGPRIFYRVQVNPPQ